MAQGRDDLGLSDSTNGSGPEAGASRGCGDERLVRSSNFLQWTRDDVCGKMKTLKGLLRAFRVCPSQPKVLLFSWSTAMLDILQVYMTAQGYSWLRLDGKTPMGDRQALLDRFNSGDAVNCFIFLISTRAGGLGLNLARASKVILYDVNWNPTNDTQAEDRAYRIGQARHLEVYRLVSTGTIEEIMYMRQLYKLQVILSRERGCREVVFLSPVPWGRIFAQHTRSTWSDCSAFMCVRDYLS
ncbi:unnamed protein product [Discosporangium mesarthrocarpum]